VNDYDNTEVFTYKPKYLGEGEDETIADAAGSQKPIPGQGQATSKLFDRTTTSLLSDLN